MAIGVKLLWRFVHGKIMVKGSVDSKLPKGLKVKVLRLSLEKLEWITKLAPFL